MAGVTQENTPRPAPSLWTLWALLPPKRASSWSLSKANGPPLALSPCSPTGFTKAGGSSSRLIWSWEPFWLAWLDEMLSESNQASPGLWKCSEKNAFSPVKHLPSPQKHLALQRLSSPRTLASKLHCLRSVFTLLPRQRSGELGNPHDYRGRAEAQLSTRTIIRFPSVSVIGRWGADVTGCCNGRWHLSKRIKGSLVDNESF